MQIRQQQLQQAVSRGLISGAQAEALWAMLAEDSQHTPTFRASHVLYYFGGLLAIGAMTLFMNLGWERFGGWGLFFLALFYAGAGLWLGERLLFGKRLAIPAGILITFAVALTPLAVYGLQQALGLWAEGMSYRDYHVFIDWRWMLMELATLVAAAVALWRYRLPFIMLPVAVTLWYMSMDLAPWLAGEEGMSWELSRLVSLYFGLAMTLLAFWVDVRSRRSPDYAFWLYLFGVAAFWGGLSFQSSDSELNKLLYCCINLALIAVGTLLSRRVFAVFGALGVAGYLGHLAWTVFRDSLGFPFALTVIGLGIVWLGIVWQRHEEAIRRRWQARLPAALRELLQRDAG